MPSARDILFDALSEMGAAGLCNKHKGCFCSLDDVERGDAFEFCFNPEGCVAGVEAKESTNNENQ